VRRVTGVAVPLFALCVAIASPQAQEVRAEDLKAAVLSKFPHFVEWPESALSQRTTIDLCIVRPNPFGKTLDELISGETLRGRRIIASELTDIHGADACHVLFLSNIRAAERRGWLAKVKSLPVLTVGDYPTFLDEGGIVGLRMVNGRVRFDVDAASAGRAGLRFSSQLLRLADRVRGGPL
jgi:hypothetical protein